MKNETYTIQVIHDEDTAFYTVSYLTYHFPNASFEGLENGWGGYDLKVRAKYSDFIEPHTLDVFRKESYIVSRIVGHTLAAQKQESKKS